MLTSILKLSQTQTEPSADTLSAPISFRSFATKTIQNIDGKFCETPVFVENQIPFWMKQNYGEENNDNYFISFLTEYYKWIKCGFKDTNLQLTPSDIEILFDIDQVPDEFITYYMKSYAPFLVSVELDDINKQNIRSFIKSIKSDFLITKGTESAYRYILKTIFNISNVNIDYPKKYLTRLNGGKFIDFTWDASQTIIDLPENFNPQNPIENDILSGNVGYSPNRPNLYGSALNESILPDNSFWQDYSYILTSNAEPDEVFKYETTILNATHPAGIKPFFEQYISIGETELIPDQGIGGGIFSSLAEYPSISKYLLYYPNIPTDPSNNYTEVFYNLYSGLSGYICYCCDGSCDPSGSSSVGPQHLFPSWDPEIKQDIEITNGTLGHMKIGNFLELSFGAFSEQYSPNENLTTCDQVECGS